MFALTVIKIAAMALEDHETWLHLIILCVLLFGQFERSTSLYACYFYSAELLQLMTTIHHLIRWFINLFKILEYFFQDYLFHSPIQHSPQPIRSWVWSHLKPYSTCPCSPWPSGRWFNWRGPAGSWWFSLIASMPSLNKTLYICESLFPFSHLCVFRIKFEVRETDKKRVKLKIE